MRSTLYRRVSKDRKKQERSVEQQWDDYDAVCKSEGWHHQATFTDNDRSASRHARKEREQYPVLLQHLSDGSTDLLALWEPSRGDRELERWARLLNLCRDKGILIHIISHHRTYDLSNPRDWRTLADDGVDSAYESEKTRERVLRDVRSNAVKGRPHGKLLFGYTRQYDERGNFVAQIPNPEQAAVVQEICRRVASGEACYSIAQDLNARGVMTSQGKKWDLSQVKRYAINPAYAGLRVHQGKVIGKAVWPAIVDEKTYQACVARLTDPRRATTRDRALKHLLSGLATCWHCGSPVKTVKNRGCPSYACAGTTKPDQRFCVSIAIEGVEEFIKLLVTGRLAKPDAAAVFLVEDESKDDGSTNVKELRERLDGWYQAARRGQISPEGLAHIEAGLLDDIRGAEARVKKRAGSPLVRRMIEAPDTEAEWESLTVGQRRELVSILLTIQVKKTYQGARTLDPDRIVTEWRTTKQASS